jgi:hypothetical protein
MEIIWNIFNLNVITLCYHDLLKLILISHGLQKLTLTNHNLLNQTWTNQPCCPCYDHLLVYFMETVTQTQKQ